MVGRSEEGGEQRREEEVGEEGVEEVDDRCDGRDEEQEEPFAGGTSESRAPALLDANGKDTAGIVLVWSKYAMAESSNMSFDTPSSFMVAAFRAEVV